MLFFILGYFSPFYPSHSPKNENFKTMKKILGDIIILHKCTKNHDYILYCSWDIVRDGCNYFSFWAIFCPFTPLTAQNMKISKKLKKKKKHLEISFYTSVPKIMLKCCTVRDIWCLTDVIIFHFWLLFALLPP